MLTSSTKKKIDTARDILVGKIPMPTSQVEQITLALTYKFMSDMDKAARELGDTSGFFANGYEKYAWDKLMDKSLPARDRVKLYGEGLEKMALNPHIPQLFRDIFRNAFLPFNDPETLKLFLDTIDQFEYEHSEELGNAFEYLLQVMGSQGDAGQFRTPRHIIDFIVEVVGPKKTDKILDPACGTAGFLISAYKWLKINGLKNDEMEKVSDNFVGYDISQDMQRLSLVNMYLHQFPDPHIYEYDTLTSEERWEEDFDVILANPPFMTPKGGIKPHNRFSVPSKRAEVLFVDYIMEHLTVNGKAGVIVPEGIIFQRQNAYKKLRKMMVDDDYLWAVVSLPSGVFQPYSGVKTSILLFDREIAKKTNKILFVKVENDGYDLGAQRRAIKENDLPVSKALLKAYKQSVLEGKELNEDTVLDLGGSTSDKKQMQSYGYDLSANDHIELSQIMNKAYHEIENKKIREGGEYNLSAERYAVKTKHSSDYSMVCLGDLVDMQNGYAFSRKQWRSDGFPIIRIQNLTGTQEEFNYTDGKDVDEKYRVDKGDLLISWSGTLGFYFWEGETAYLNQHIYKVSISEKIDKRFFYFLGDSIVNKALSRLHGNTMKHITRGRLESIEIPLPPLSVQQEIVEELDGYQKIIDGARQVVDNYRPSFKIEDDWEWVELGNVSEVTSSKRVYKNDYVSNGVPFYRSKEIIELSKGKNPSIELFISQDHFQELDNKFGSPNLNDVLITAVGTIGDVYVVDSNKKFYFKDGNILWCRKINKLIDPKFLAMNLRLQVKLKKNVLSAGSAYKALTIVNLKRLKVPLPPLEVQKRIISDIKIEKDLIDSNRKLINKFQTKIKARIDDIWGK